jgi:CubicO group peptidase (beta-lactamase class C family)
MSQAGAPNRRQVLALAALAGAAEVAGPVRSPAETPNDTAIQAVRTAAAAAIERGSAPGYMVAIARDWKPVFQQGFGHANLEWSIPVDTETTFHIGSMTKQFTAAAILRLREMGKLSVDDPLARYLPAFPGAGGVTLRQMLTHTSGLRNFLENVADYAVLQRQDLSLGQLVDHFARSPKVYDFDPGTAQHYSNTAFVMLGAVIEAAAGESYDAFLRREVFARAGLTATAVDSSYTIAPRRASGYEAVGPGSFRNASFISMTIPGTAGAIRSTGPDLLAWRRALFAGEVITPSSLAMMLTPARLANGALARDVQQPRTPWKNAYPEGDYGMGVYITNTNGEPRIGHRGGINGFTSDCNTYPRLGLTVVVLCNGPAAFDLTEAILPALVAAARA